MKKHLIRLCALAMAMLILAGNIQAQTTTHGKPKPRSKTGRGVKGKPGSKSTATKNKKPDATVAPVADTTAKPVAVMNADIKLDTPRKSLRNDAIIERNLVKDRTPLVYEHIREDDAVYRQRVWEELDVHEKMNLPFVYKATEDNGNQRFINILLNAIKSGQITAFDPIDDRFTTPLTFQGIANNLVAKPHTIQIPDNVNDPDGSKGLMRDTLIQEDFNPDDVERYQIKEEWVFDKESSRMHVRILGIAPEKTVRNADGSFRSVLPVFWVYYPDCRPLFAKYEAYNGKNFGARMSWEELFESRMFAGRVIKSTIDNPGDNYIAGYIKDDILRLLEGDNIKEKIFNYEQDLWSY